MNTKPILIVGGTGKLGTQVIHLLTGQGLPVRVLTRKAAHAAHLQSPLVEVMRGDVRDQIAVERAVVGVDTVISAMHGFMGTDGSNPQTVDHQGNSNLIQAAQKNDIKHFILLSIHGAAPSHPLELFRMKYKAEQALKASKLSWTIIRPTAYMETWAGLIGEPLLKTGKTTIFGSGHNPINFVSINDVAHYVELAVTNPDLRGTIIEVGGLENLSMRQVVNVFQNVSGKTGKVSAVPLPMMRIMAALMQPVNPRFASQIQAGIAMDTQDMTFNPTETIRRYPSIPLTSWEAVVRRDYPHPVLA